jgi:thiamine biosynthesis lipoprotein
VIEISDAAVATSGSYERGPHILDARKGEPARGLVSLTVVGPNMALADSYATAGFAMGEEGIGWVVARGYAACGITADRRVRYDEQFAQLVARPLAL